MPMRSEDEHLLLLARLAQEAENGRDALVIHFFHLLTPYLLSQPDLLWSAITRVLPSAQRLGDSPSLLQIHQTLGFALKQFEDFDAADDHLDQALDLARQLENRPAQARALAVRGQIAHKRADLRTGRDLLSEALKIYRQTGDHEGEARSLGDLGNLEHEAGNIATAVRRYHNAIRIFQELEVWSSIAHVHYDCCFTLMEIDPAAAVAHGLLAVAAYQRDGELVRAEDTFWKLAGRTFADLAVLPSPLAALAAWRDQVQAASARGLAEELPLRRGIIALSSYDPSVWDQYAELVSDPGTETLVERSADLAASHHALGAVGLRTLAAVLRRARVVGAWEAAKEEAETRKRLWSTDAVEAAGLTPLVATANEARDPIAGLDSARERVADQPLLRGILQALAGSFAMSDWQAASSPSAALEDAIGRLEEASQLLGPEMGGWWWLDAMRNLGSAYRNRIEGDHRENHEQAVACLEKVLHSDLAVREETLPNLVYCRLNLANALLLRPGPDIEWAIGLLETAIELLPAEPLLRGMAFQNLGLAYSRRETGDVLGNQEHALEFYKTALGHLHEGEHSHVLGKIHENIALLFWRRLTGDEAVNQEASLRHYAKAAVLFERSGWHVEAAHARQARACVLAGRFVGEPAANLDEAITESAAAVRHMQDEASDYDLAGAQNNLGNLYIDRIWQNASDQASNDLDRAESALTAALVYRPRTSLPREWAQTIHNLGTLELLKAKHGFAQDRDRAIRHYRDALSVRKAEDASEECAHTSRDLAMALIETGEPDAIDEARELLMAVVDGPSPDAYVIDASAALGDAAADDEDWHRAAQHYETAAHLHERRYASALLPGSQLRQAGQMQAVFLGLARAYVGCGDPIGSALAVERARTRLLGESLERDRLDLERLATVAPSLYDRYRRTAARTRQLTNLEAADLRPQSVSEPGPGHPARWADAADARSELHSVAAEIQALPGFSDFLRPLGTSAFEDVIAERGPLIYLALMDESIWAICCSAGGDGLKVEAMRGADGGRARVLRRIASPVIDVSARRQRNSFLLAHQKHVGWEDIDIETLCRELGSDVPPGLWTWIEQEAADRITLVPLGVLAWAPWHAATIPDGSGRRLVDLRSIAYAPSARALGSLKAPRQDHSSPAIFGDPTDELDFARQEAVELAGEFPGSALWMGAEATREAVLAAFSSVSIVHFAGHGQYEPNAPLESGLKASDGMVTLAELATQSGGVADLAVLSACQTAVTDVLSVPDEAIGLPSALLLAGANGVVASLWEVPDRSTRELMGHFYQAIASGHDPAAALREAQLALSAPGAETYGARDWAGFVYIGG